MIDATHAAAAQLGWAPERVRSEKFTAAISGDASPFTVHLQRSGKTVQVGSDVSILDALIADGVSVLWDCRRGECGLCPLPVIEAQGGIEHHDHYLTAEEKNQMRRYASVSRELEVLASCSTPNGYCRRDKWN